MMMWIFCLVSFSSAFYLPGVAPKDYKQDENIDLYFDKLDSATTELPFDTYYLNFCRPEHVKLKDENLGQTLSGDKIETSPYEIKMNKEIQCKPLCTMENKNQHLKRFEWMIENQYKASWVMDNLPSGLRQTIVNGNEGTKVSYYQDGFPIGYKEGKNYFIYNHHHIVIQVYPTLSGEVDTWRIVGFLVEPISMDNGNHTLGCNSKAFLELEFANLTWAEAILKPQEKIESTHMNKIYGVNPQHLERNITYTYSVIFEISNVKWASRWDHYLYRSGESAEVHWLSIINSFAMVLFLSGMVAHILGRTVRRDINTYNESVDLDEESETGWKQIRGDVFRPPVYAGIFSVIIGSGVQVIGMAVLSLFFASIGFLSPAHRGGLITTALIFYVFMGVFSGYTSARLYKFFGGDYWKRNALATAFLFPGLCFFVFFIINSCLWGAGSSGSVPFSSLVELLLLWFGISVPLVFFGNSLGYRKPTIEVPCKINKIPKPLEMMPGTSKIKAICLMAGSLPFGCMFIELDYVMKSLWHHTLFYYLFGFLFLCFIVLVITSAEVSILMVYISLCREDYRWWWLSFSVAGSSGIYMFGYAVVYYLTQLSIDMFSSTVLYFGYMLLCSVAYSLVTGTIGFFATFIFTRTIYSLIKAE
ncbi:unnamed protein product [Blepharisma stoltei]|uniref:Transmembrane 9 superfamily member n=1 Tax=Blepharisma stoltei TaxID=1481888 RepID=A0AAU9JKJ3_9CILI|nr:unnamed protein product [Blepharisma stoltei]